MKYTFSAILALVLCMAFVFGCQAPASQQTPSSGLANPMVESNPDEILQKLGVEFLVPEGAEDVRYFIISDKMAEMQFRLDGSDCNARIQPESEFTDISGMYYDWVSTENCSIGSCEGKLTRASENGNSVSCCLWYDAVPGLMYSLSVIGGSADTLSVAVSVYTPMQTES